MHDLYPRIGAAWQQLLNRMFDPYRPECHYMRGPRPEVAREASGAITHRCVERACTAIAFGLPHANASCVRLEKLRVMVLLSQHYGDCASKTRIRFKSGPHKVG
jgi:hypothetical protein